MLSDPLYDSHSSVLSVCYAFRGLLLLLLLLGEFFDNARLLDYNDMGLLCYMPATPHSLIHLPPTHHSHPPSHTHYLIPGSKLAFSTNLFHHSLLAPTRTAFSDYD